MRTVTLFLKDDKITPNEFREWVDHVTRKLFGRYPNPDGPWATQGGAWFISHNKISIIGYYLINIGTDKESYCQSEIGNIEVNRIGKRLKVIFTYSDMPKLIPYFVKFFNEFAIDWPDAANILEQELLDIQKVYGERAHNNLIPQPPTNADNDEALKGKKGPGRYRLTPDEIKARKKIVRDARRRKKADPMKYWREIAKEMKMSYNTLRYYLHDPQLN